MITVTEAQRIVASQVPSGPKREIALREGRGLVLADTLLSPIDSPSFDSSAMDGFAVRRVDTEGAAKERPVALRVVETIAAGTVPTRRLSSRESARIMTGAMIPPGADGVIPQEEVVESGSDTISVSRSVARGENILRRGEELKRGEVALQRGAPLNPAAIGFLASLGIERVPVFAKPRVAIVPTGSELVQSFSEWSPGRVFESNSAALSAALRELSIESEIVPPVTDSEGDLKGVLGGLFETADFVLITGGVSVGRFDFVRGVLADLGVETLFWRVAQKPGKPLFFGRKEDRFVLGLPGNPASSLVCFYEYVRPALRRWLGFRELFLREGEARIEGEIRKKGGRTDFVRALAWEDGGALSVRPTGDQGSHRMGSFVDANCLMVLPSERTEYGSGDVVTIHWLPS